MTVDAFIAGISLAAWVYLLGFRGLFWRFRERDDSSTLGTEPRWPSVVAVVPARNEADSIERSLRSLEAQDYPGEFRIVVVDDQSTDDTAERIRALHSRRITLVSGSARPKGWTGKVWAQQQGVAAADSAGWCDFYWLTDADIIHSHDNLSRLVAQAQSARLVLVSLMAKLSCRSAAERFLIPAFVFFFAMLYPFAWINDGRKQTAGAAGGCMLVRRDVLQKLGGMEAIRAEIIDDCALARRLKRQGSIWLGLSHRSVSVRAYSGFEDIRSTVARTAFTQLHYSWPMLVITVLAMAVIYAAPPFLVMFGSSAARLFAALAWLCMIVAFIPISRFYGLSVWRGVALPAIGICYAGFTLDSAIRYLRGRGGMWKGRIQALSQNAQADTAQLSSGKTHHDENFPVASLLVAPRHRGIILAFYRFVREADDIADHPTADAGEKLRLLDEMRRSLIGETENVASGVKLRRLLTQRGLTAQHALDLLEAFRRDVTKLRYGDWNDLIDYCSVSAMPVGRFVLDVHGESPSVWPLNDALCAALQVVNHLQDCGADYKSLNRVYIPLDAFAAANANPEMLGKNSASPELLAAIRRVAFQTQDLLDRAALFSSSIRDRRLSLEVRVIHRLACDLNRRLFDHDPLSQRVHHTKAEAMMLGTSAVLRRLFSARTGDKRAVVAEGH